MPLTVVRSGSHLRTGQGGGQPGVNHTRHLAAKLLKNNRPDQGVEAGRAEFNLAGADALNNLG